MKQKNIKLPSPPSCPIEPIRTFKEPQKLIPKEVNFFNSSDCGTHKLSDIINDSGKSIDDIFVRIDSDDYDDIFRVEFFFIENVENKKYENELKAYNGKESSFQKKLEKYNLELEVYNKELKKYNSIIDAINAAIENAK